MSEESRSAARVNQEHTLCGPYFPALDCGDCRSESAAGVGDVEEDAVGSEDTADRGKDRWLDVSVSGPHLTAVESQVCFGPSVAWARPDEEIAEDCFRVRYRARVYG